MSEMEKECTSCKQKILADATKCHHCGNPQNIFARLGQMSLILSLLATIFSLIALSSPLVKSVFVAKAPEIKASVLKGLGSELKFAVFNSGDAPAAIKQAQVSYVMTSGNSVMHVLRGNIEQVLEPNKTTYVNAKSASDASLPIMLFPGLKLSIKASLPQVCILEIIYSDFDGKELSHKSKYECLAG